MNAAIVGSQLHYVDASQVVGDGAHLDGLDVVEEAGAPLGRLDGLLVDAAAKRVRYVVVESGSAQSPLWHAWPFTSARLDRHDWTLRLDVDRSEVSPFSKVDRQMPLIPAGDAKTTRLFETLA